MRIDLHESLQDILPDILAQYRLPVFGTHGVSHWARVLENGTRLAAENGAKTSVIAYFAIFHDACRWNEGIDPGHGLRGADLVEKMRERIELQDEEIGQLMAACRLHTDGLLDGDITIQTCWDSDRLDLPRVGIPISPARLCTEAARHPDTVDWATERARDRAEPDFLWSHWRMKRYSAGTRSEVE